MDKPEVFNKNINSRFHESTPVLPKMANHVFTRNNYLNGKTKDSRRIILLKTLQATKRKRSLITLSAPKQGDYQIF
jgi:hypothetical protein